MKKKKVWRYYCEFCKKSGCNASHMKRHEAGCTANPNRVCGLCHAAGLSQKPINDLIAALGNGDKVGVETLRELADNCPTCMLAAIRQSGLQHGSDGESLPDGTGYYDPGLHVEFDYRSELADFWKSVNEEINSNYLTINRGRERQ